jgi:hypothetical protein
MIPLRRPANASTSLGRGDDTESRAERFQWLVAAGVTGGLAIGTVCCFLFSHVFWTFSCNVYHSAFTLIWMVVGLLALNRGEAAAFNLTNGVFLAGAGITYFVPELRALQREYHNVNWATTGLHFSFAALQLGTYVYAARLAIRGGADATRSAGFWLRVPPSAFLPGAVLLAIAGGGFAMDHVLGVFRLNVNAAACIFLSLGVAGVLSAGRGHMRGFMLLAGTFLLGLGLLDLVPQLHTAQVNFLRFNGAMSTFLVVFGATAVAISFHLASVGADATPIRHLHGERDEAPGTYC